MSCDYCSDPASSSYHDKEWGSICRRCFEQITGKSFSPHSYDRQFKNGDLVVWIKGEKIVSAWCMDGSCSIPKSVWGNITTIRGAIWYMHNERKKGNVWCATCGEMMKQDEVAGSHFAGYYCKQCWIKYKEEHDGRCLICGVPRYKCCC